MRKRLTWRPDLLCLLILYGNRARNAMAEGFCAGAGPQQQPATVRFLLPNRKQCKRNRGTRGSIFLRVPHIRLGYSLFTC